MPLKPWKQCGNPRCPNLTRGPYCDECKPKQNRKHRSDNFYRSAAWLRLRRAHLREHPLCVDCVEDPSIDPPALATEVDHVQSIRDRPDLKLDPSNLASLCKSHHSRKTVLFDGGFGNPRR